MSSYYTALMILCIASMLSVQLCVVKSATLSHRRKRLFYLLFSSIAIACLCEWIGVLLQGTGAATRTLHIIVKAMELSLAPSIAVWIAWVIEYRRSKLMLILLAVQAAMEWASGIFGFIYSVDADSVYTHERFYWIYTAAYLASIVYYLYVVIRNLRKYQYSGGASALSTVAVMLAGIFMQMRDSQLRVIYITLALAAVMAYVFALEMIQQTDELTELINRRGFENYIANIDEPSVILFFDVDHFKEINDTYGHGFGDQVLRTIGKAILKQYARVGKCFRYGGDEFCVILNKELDQVEKWNDRFVHALDELRTDEPKLPTVSIGYAHYDPEGCVGDAVAVADQMMYRSKKERYGGSTEVR